LRDTPLSSNRVGSSSGSCRQIGRERELAHELDVAADTRDSRPSSGTSIVRRAMRTAEAGHAELDLDLAAIRDARIRRDERGGTRRRAAMQPRQR
jgi:hypothetical protein